MGQRSIVLTYYFLLKFIIINLIFTVIILRPFWCTEESQENVKDILEYYIENYNVYHDKIVVTGHSLVDQGTMYMKQTLPEYFLFLKNFIFYLDKYHLLCYNIDTLRS